MHGETVKYCYI